MKKQMSAACHYAYTRLALNYYMYYEIMLEGDLLGSRLADLDERYHRQMKAFLAGTYEVSELDRLRNEAALAMEVNNAYTDAFQAYEYVMNRLEGRFEPQILGSRTAVFDEEAMASEIMEYLTDTDEAGIVNERIQAVLGQLPVRLTRQKFFAMMEKGLSLYKGGSERSLNDMLYVLRSEAMLRRPEDMETGYEELHSILHEFEQADYKNMTLEVYRHLSSEIKRAGCVLMDTTGEIVLFMDLINDLYVLMLSRHSAVMEVSEEKRLRGILSSLRSLFEGGAREPIPQEITDSLSMLEGRQEAYFKQWIRLETEPARADQAGARDGDEEEEGNKLRVIGLLMSGSSFMSLEPGGINEDRRVDDALFREKMNLMREELSDSWQEMPRVLVRAVMAKILSRLPIFFGSLEELGLYIEGSLRSCADVQEKEAAMRMIRILKDLDEFDVED